MSERQSEQDPAEDGAARPEPSSTPPVEPVGPPRRSSRAALWLAGLLILILAAVALSPFWAPKIAPLFPWGENGAEYASLAARVAAVETRPAPPGNGIDAVKSATSTLARRVDQIETALDARLGQIEKRPASPSADIDPINSALGVLARRVDHLEAAANADHQTEAGFGVLSGLGNSPDAVYGCCGP